MKLRNENDFQNVTKNISFAYFSLFLSCDLNAEVITTFREEKGSI